MPKLFKKYPEGTFIALAIVFSVIILGYFIFGVISAARGVENVVTINKSGTENIGLDLDGAKKLNLRGLMQ